MPKKKHCADFCIIFFFLGAIFLSLIWGDNILVDPRRKHSSINFIFSPSLQLNTHKINFFSLIFHPFRYFIWQPLQLKYTFSNNGITKRVSKKPCKKSFWWKMQQKSHYILLFLMLWLQWQLKMVLMTIYSFCFSFFSFFERDDNLLYGSVNTTMAITIKFENVAAYDNISLWHVECKTCWKVILISKFVRCKN